MKNIVSIPRIFRAGAVGLALVLLSSCTEKTPPNPAQAALHPSAALAKLLAGNQRFLNGTLAHPRQTHQRVLETEGAQHPFAVVVTCSDSRVPPEIIFDEGIGDLFVIRTAGNLMDDLELGSIEYAVEHLGASLVVVLGHTECGAVKAFLEGGEACGHIKNIVEALADEAEEQQVLRQKGKDLPACIEGNILHGVAQIRQDEPVLSEKIRAGKLAVVPMLYDVHTGKVVVLE
jgi:carbonic anhydrase